MSDEPHYPYRNGQLQYRLDRIRDAAALHRQGLITTAELYAVIEADPEPGPAATEATEPATIADPEWLRQQYAEVMLRVIEPFRILVTPEVFRTVDELATAVTGVRDRHLDQLRQRLRLADELLATRDAELAAAKKTARGIGAWGVLQAIEQALPPARDDGPTVAEAAADDRTHWNDKYDRP